MDTSEPAGPGGTEAGQPGEGSAAGPAPLRHYSTGRLTGAQARLVNSWRARLLEDRPVPGQRPVGELARLLGATDWPPASSSDAIAAAVAGLLARQPPGPPDLARYAYAGMQAQQAAGRAGVPGDADDTTPMHPPVSWYLPADIAGEAEQLRAAAYDAVVKARDEVRRQAYDQFPGFTEAAATARALFMLAELASMGLPFCKQVPRGAIARMAVDRWGPRDPDQVAADAVAYAAAVHDQPHRARRDMRPLRR